MSSSFDRQFQQRLELIFRKAEFDRMQEFRVQREIEQKRKAAQESKNDNGTKCDKKGPSYRPF